MSTREFIALGTSSQVPTRERSHNSYLLRWEGKGFLFDPGEGTQRQLILAGIAPGAIHFICITHFHGDHCLGLPGVLQRLSLDRCEHPVRIYYPESGQPYLERLCKSAISESNVDLILNPVTVLPDEMVTLDQSGRLTLKAHLLEHSVPTIGFRLEETGGRQLIRERLELAGVQGPDISELQRKGSIKIGGRPVKLEEVSIYRPGSVFAFVMDTGPCPGAVALARDADLLVMESTYTSECQDLARLYKHSTALDAANAAISAGVHHLALTHFSQRYPDSIRHLLEAKGVLDSVSTLNDLDRIVIPRRTAAEPQAKNARDCPDCAD
jgi:ribonuclease Z